ncbi:MAG: 3-dehydroquinate synthase [Chitinophagaceae bacterium]
MPVQKYSFNHQSVNYYFDAAFVDLKKIVQKQPAIIITDENVFAAHHKRFKSWKTIVLKAGEAYKVQATVDSIISQLIELNADRDTLLIGVGGGVVTDITGYVASIFLRGISFGFVPTTVLAMVDASIGGKNGIDVGMYKNMVGTIKQPHFLLFDTALLKTLPDQQWRNGFAEIIKHAAIKDEVMSKELKENSLKDYQKNKEAFKQLIKRNALLKTKVVQGDEFEKGERKLLNFGHTLGHALENQYNLMHGEAVSIGMAFAANLSQKMLGFKQAPKLITLIQKYGLPTEADYNKKKVVEMLLADKKREGDSINFILLEKIGKAVIKKIPLEQLYKQL